MSYCLLHVVLRRVFAPNVSDQWGIMFQPSLRAERPGLQYIHETNRWLDMCVVHVTPIAVKYQSFFRMSPGETCRHLIFAEYLPGLGRWLVWLLTTWLS